MSLVTIEKADGIAVLTLNRPEALNALSQALRADLAGAISDASEDDDQRVIVLTGSGDRAFCAGIDLKELGDPDAPSPPPRDTSTDPVEAIRACPKPVIAAINGVAVTGGLELALACDILIASDAARFADTHVRVGIQPGWGLTRRLPLAIGHSRASEMAFTGNFIDARTAGDWGMVNRVVPPGELMAEARRIAADIATCDPRAVAFYKATIAAGIGMEMDRALAMEDERGKQWMKTVTAEAVEQRRADVLRRGRSQGFT